MHVRLPRLFYLLALAAPLAAQSPFFQTFGPGCSSAMAVSRLTLFDPPVQGGTLRFEADNLPNNTALMLTGLSNTSSVFGPLPGPIGSVPGCELRVSPDATRFLIGVNNIATYSLTIPSGTGLVGFRLFQQALVFDSTAGPDQFVMSDAAEFVVGLPGWPLNGTPLPDMVPILPGSFQMGSNVAGPQAQPVHTVNITQPFWIGKYEVTQGQYESVMNTNPAFFQGFYYPNYATLPVETVSRDDAMSYCAALTAQERAAGRLPAGYQYRLPTEAEWEYCCRAGTTTEYSVGNTLGCTQANFYNCVTETTDVGSYPPNPWGLHDMHGNVYEWCLDDWDATANYPAGPVSDPYVTRGPGTVFRGGCWNNDVFYCSSPARPGRIYSPSYADWCIGFRVVLGPVKVPENMVPMSAGTFQMGSTAGYPESQPVHTVNITRPFWIGKHEVTQDEYESVMGSNPSFHQGASYVDSGSRPVERVDWTDAMSYCAALTAQEAAAGRLPAGYHYRLPTEAEWEYCCRAGTTTEYSFGNSVTCAEVNSFGCVGETQTVGSAPANPWGLHEMHGNVYEWCLDSADGTANYPSGTVSDPWVTSGPNRVFRGGSWDNGAFFGRSAYRALTFGPSYAVPSIGFRVVLAPTRVAENMVPIPAGTFQMGSTQGQLHEQPVHSVTITRPFWMGKFEVTQAEYQAVMNGNPSQFQGAARPVEQVSWSDALAYCAALTAREAALGRIPEGYQYRLPTEAEWEYCCRAGATTEWNLGTGLSCVRANKQGCIGQTTDVGAYEANLWGLFDMHGNVWEWVLDSWDGSSGYATGPVSDPFVSLGFERILRGGSWARPSTNARSAWREPAHPAHSLSDLGFRVVLAPVRVPDTMVPIASGTFAMGSTQGLPREQPIHTVTIEQPFWIGRHEVTQAEYAAIMSSNPSQFQGADRPVDSVSWNDAMSYCAALTAADAAAGRLPQGYQYRLPTEAEWEYCCRAGTATEWYTGTSLNQSQASFNNAQAQTSAVGSYAANPWGIHDMHGNLWEWCLDAWDGSSGYRPGAVVDPYYVFGQYRVFRGGAFDSPASSCRSGYRARRTPPHTANNVGFRIVLAPARVVADGLVRIQEGPFQMGSNSTLAQLVEQPRHLVSITKAFWAGAHEVTQAEYEAVMNTNPSAFPGPNRPVEQVSWHDAMAYCVQRTELEAAAHRIPPGYQYRLPTEAEWEYLCRSGAGTEWNTGTSLSTTQANFNNAVAQTTVVGSYAPNNRGLFDMHGNVYEWCLDSWDLSANYPGGPVSDPFVNVGFDRIQRGGSWGVSGVFCRSAARRGEAPTTSRSDLGFRVVLGPSLF